MPASTRHTQLDGLRGYAAVAVVIFHTILDRDPTQNVRIVRTTFQQVHGAYDILTKLAFVAANGETAVVTFFVLSGAVLFESLRQRHAGTAATALGFSIRRLLRLYPTFFVALAGCLAALAVVGAWSFASQHFWPNALLYDFSILGASWTLQVEFLAIPFILLGFWGYKGFGVMGIAAAYAFVASLLCVPWLGTHFVYCQRFLSCFALGLLVPTGLGAAIAKRAPSVAGLLVLVGALASRHVMGLHWWSMDTEQICAALLVALLYYGRAGSLGRFLDWPLSQYLGRLSYSIYLFNIIYIILVEHWTQDVAITSRHPLEFGLLLSVPTLAAAILTAHWTEIALERPCVALGRRLTRFSVRPAPAGAVAPALL
jgi:peptidoglycan/LPS O-acetylase OafA/YrhL